MPSPPRPDIERVYPNCEFSASFMNDRLTAADHVITLLSSSSSLMYAMRVLRVHGTPTASLHDIFQATVVSRIQYASPAWSGMCSAADRARLDSLLRRGKRLGYAQTTCRPSLTYSTPQTTTSSTVHRFKTNSHHVLQPYLPDQTDISYQLRIRSHNINKTKFLNDADFIIRMIHKYSY